MCGICGIVSRTPIKDIESVVRMQKALEHRGPDSGDQYIESNVILGVRRLSIIDISSGQQPLYNEDRSLVLIANAEIYNFVELRFELESRGHRFQTHSDCETILHLYEEYGSDCVQRLRGMFAFALWDIPQKKLLLARDRMGEKPLYMHQSADTIVFASELQALLHTGRTFDFDPAAVDLYFHYQYVPEPLTLLKGVRKLPAGYTLTIDVPAWREVEKCYWRIEDAPPLQGNPAELIRERLDELSRIVIRSDVPVGVALSGGLDSSIIAALAARYYPGTLQAFSVGYPGYPPYDERQDAKRFAEHVKIPFHEIELRTEDMASFFPELVILKDDPIADISGYGYYSVMKRARDFGVPVMLQGQGADELFWGYDWVRQAVEESVAKNNLLGGNTSLWDYVRGNGLRPGWKRFRLHKSSAPNQVIFYDLVPDFQSALAHMSSYYTPDFLERLGASNAFELFTHPRPWPALDVLMTRLICQTYLLENGIAQGDRLSMASSVELRLPFLDYRLVETVIGLRKQISDYQLPPKAWLKDAVSDLLPPWVMQRRKRGFEPPVREWHNALFHAHGSLLKDGYLVQSGILKAGAAEKLSDGIFPSNAAVPLSFKALVLEIWLRRFSSSV